MDIDLSKEDLAFRDEVRSFFEDSKIKDGEDYFSWREEWFKKAREKGGWDVPKWPAKFGGPGWTPTQHYIWEQETAKATVPPIPAPAPNTKQTGFIRSSLNYFTSTGCAVCNKVATNLFS